MKSKIEVLQKSNTLPNMVASSLPPGNNGQSSFPQNLRILFLDVDGVLNSHKIQVLYKNLAHPRYVVSPEGKHVYNAECSDKYAAMLVDNICHNTGAYVVLSSSWRLGLPLDFLKGVLQELGVNPSLLIGKTTSLTGNRGKEIDHFLKGLDTEQGKLDLIEKGFLIEDFTLVKVKVESYAIVDDDSDMLESQQKNFVKTTFMEGLTCSNAIRLGQILSNDETFYLNRLGGMSSAGESTIQ